MMMYRYNHLGDIVGVIDEMVVGVDPDTGEPMTVEKIDEAATAALMAPEARRARAYVAEADPLRDRAMNYRTEAEGWRLLGDEEKAASAEANAEAALREYVAKKAEIRARIPDPTYCLASSGVYHAEGCSYASASGDWLTLAGIAAANPAAKACSRCNPPALP